MILAGIILLVFLVLSVKRPLWSLGIILALLPTYLIRFKILNIPTTWLELMLGVFFLSVIFRLDQSAWDKIKNLKKINWAIAGFMVAAIVATLISPEKTRALGQLKAFFIEPVLFFYAVLIIIKNPEQLKTPLQFLFWSTTAVSLFGLIQYWTHLFLPLRFWGYGLEIKRITSVFEYPNALALYLAPIFILFIVLHAKDTKIVKRHWMAIGLLLMLTALVLTYSRGAWLGTAAALGLLAVHLSKHSVKKWGTGILIVLILLSPVLFSRFKNTFIDNASTERVSLYRTSWDKIMEQPLLGNGLAGFNQTLIESNYAGGSLNYPHNIILNFWLEIGLLGVISFFVIIALSLKEYQQKPNAYKLAAGLVLITILVHGFVDAPYFKNDLSILFWFVISIFYVTD